MSFEDKSLQCSDCSTTFTFTAGEQEFYQTKGFTNEPKRCPDCRRANKANRSGSGNSSGSYGSRY
ncbi:zinc-ribbon domain-containing protein [Chloroflexota bacterium]